MFFAYWDDPQGMPRLALLGGGREEVEARLKGLYHQNHPWKPLPSGMGRKGVASEAR